MWQEEPSCSVRVQPEIDARGFWRWSNRGNSDELPRPVTYTIPQNIIKVSTPTHTAKE